MQIAISKTPLRISLFGGGTDLKSYYKITDGAVLSFTIDKFLYVVVKKNQNYVDFKYRIFWSKTEFSNDINKIKHPLAREILKYFKIDFPIEISTFSEIPANTGMGSSSSFAVGMIKAISSLLDLKLSKSEIAKIASHIEINILKRNIGKQDHYAAAFGGLNLIHFKKNERVLIKKIKISKKISLMFKSNFILFYLKKKRDASKILKSQLILRSQNFEYLDQLKLFVSKSIKIINSSDKHTPKQIGLIMDKSWELKKKNNKNTSYKEVDNFYKLLLKNSFYGGKLLGAGGGGYMLAIGEKKTINNFISNFKKYPTLNVNAYEDGSAIIYKN